MGFIDIVLAILLGFGIYKGLKNGLFVEIASLVSFFVGIYIAIKFSYVVGDYLGDSITKSDKTAKIIAFVITFIGVIAAVHLLAKFFSGVFSFANLGWLNKLGGAFFAAIKTAIMLGIVLSLFQKINIDNRLVDEKTQNESLFFNPLMQTSEILLPVLKEWFLDLKEKV